MSDTQDKYKSNNNKKKPRVQKCKTESVTSGNCEEKRGKVKGTNTALQQPSTSPKVAAPEIRRPTRTGSLGFKKAAR